MLRLTNGRDLVSPHGTLRILGLGGPALPEVRQTLAPRSSARWWGLAPAGEIEIRLSSCGAAPLLLEITDARWRALSSAIVAEGSIGLRVALESPGAVHVTVVNRGDARCRFALAMDAVDGPPPAGARRLPRPRKPAGHADSRAA